MKASLITLTAAAAASLALAAPTAPSDPAGASASVSDQDDTVIPGQFIVLLKSPSNGAGVETRSLARRHSAMAAGIAQLGMESTHTYEIGPDFHSFALKGNDVDTAVEARDVAARWTSQKIVDALNKTGEIEAVLPDHTVELDAVAAGEPKPLLGVNWGLHRISHQFDFEMPTYRYRESPSTNSTYVYVIDTGIHTNHTDFEGRARFGANFVPRGKEAPDGPYVPVERGDDHGHGTHVAGVVGSKTYGVAKEANLIGVKVMNRFGRGSDSNILAGIQWVVDDATKKGRVGKSVVNMSVGGPRHSSGDAKDAIMAAAAAAVQQGLFFTVAAGNKRPPVPATAVTPAAEPSVCTVGAIDIQDNFAEFSNYGPGVDVNAPGVMITSLWRNGGARDMNGTSMASPHVAGLAAYLIAQEGARSPADLRDRIVGMATSGQVKQLKDGTPDLIAYNGGGR